MKKSRSDCYFPLFFNDRLSSVILFGLLVLAGCSSALYMPTGENTGPGAELPALLEGRKLYINNCGGCHSLVLPEKFNARQWTVWVDSMANRSKINTAEKTLILRYLKKE